MSQMQGGLTRGAAPAGPNVYTVLALVATLVLLAAVIYVGVKNYQMTGQANPFAVVSAQEIGGR